MSANDEYSSDEESFDESTKSKVLLGFVDAPIISDGKDPEDNDLPTIEDTFIEDNQCGCIQILNLLKNH